MSFTILLLEDNPLDAMFFRAVLGSFGYRVISAANPREGVALALTERPNLMIVDNLLTSGFGAEAIRGVRAESTLAQTPIIATSSYATNRERQNMKDAGCTIFMDKPIAVDALLAAVGQLVE